MYQQLQRVFTRPEPFEVYTAETLWADPHISAQMLAFHLDPDVEPASRNRAFLNRSIAWICERFQVGPGVRIADFGCGPGLYSLPLAERGAEVTGIDFSPRSIAYARAQAAAQGVAVNYVEQNYLTFSSSQRFDLATLIYCDYCALSPDQRQSLLGIIRNHLADNGLLLFDVFTLAAYDQRTETSVCAPRLMDGFWAPGEYYGFMQTLKYDAARVVLDKYTIVEAERTREVYNWLQYFSREMLTAELAAGGFEVVEWYGDVSGAAFQEEGEVMAVVVRKS